MCVSRECPSPSFALINQDTIWNTRSLKVYLLEHDSPVPEGQFDDTSIHVDPTPTQTMLKEKLSLSKNSSPKLDKKDIAVEEKTDGAETTLHSIMCRDDSFTQQRSTLYSMCLKHKLVLSQLLMIEEQVFKVI